MAQKQAPVLSFELPEESTIPVKIGKKTYQVNPGNFSVALDMPGLIDSWRALATAHEDPEALVSQLEDLQGRTEALVSAVFGEAGSDELVGGDHRLDIVRILAVLDIIASIYSSDEAMAKVTGSIPQVPVTADED